MHASVCYAYVAADSEVSSVCLYCRLAGPYAIMSHTVFRTDRSIVLGTGCSSYDPCTFAHRRAELGLCDLQEFFSELRDVDRDNEVQRCVKHPVVMSSIGTCSVLAAADASLSARVWELHAGHVAQIVIAGAAQHADACNSSASAKEPTMWSTAGFGCTASCLAEICRMRGYAWSYIHLLIKPAQPSLIPAGYCLRSSSILTRNSTSDSQRHQKRFAGSTGRCH